MICARRRYRISFTRVLFPEPDTPVMATNIPSGMRTSMSFRLCSRAPRTTSASGFGLRRRSGKGIRRRPERYAPVIERGSFRMSSIVPSATISPPCSPAPATVAFVRGAPPERLAHGERCAFGDVPLCDRDGECLGLEALALAHRTRALAHIALDVGTDVIGRRLAVLPLEPRQHALPFVLVRAPLAAPVLVRQFERVLGAVKDRVDRFLGQRLHRRVERKLEAARQAFEDR